MQNALLTAPRTAVLARAHVAWDGWRGVEGGAPRPQLVLDAWAAAYTTADLRARGLRGYGNRHERKRERRRALTK